MIAVVLSDSRFTGMLLTRILTEEDRADVEIRTASSDSFFPVARSWLSQRRTPVALVMNADSTVPEAVERLRSEVAEVLRDAATGVPFKVVLAVPELEILFFRRPEFLRRLYGEAVTDHLLELAQFSPHYVLKKLDPQTPYEDLRVKVLLAMNDEDVAAIQGTEPILELRNFLDSMRRHAPVIAGSRAYSRAEN